jgi:V/A-type H+-transporting ATPase subunit K
MEMLKKFIGAGLLVLLSLIITSVVYATSYSGNVNTSDTDTQNTEVAAAGSQNNGIGMIAAALSTGLAAIGSGIAVAIVGSAALGAISENPKLLGRTIVFVGLAEGIAIYGLIISIMILNKI